ncbi:hypothetical protein HPB48_010192 [Haemaphysalis longicornis]|uniref:DDE-1 domain-containing protein n=1 Tax=Haemaphysalis longicornis TaxID=44386 RepID=A0A9J6GL05_HAELO|nr:hypothetical protein HPB48_010192 [Haemaphysalis longicornis]
MATLNEVIFLRFVKHFVVVVRCSQDHKVLIIVDSHSSHTVNLDAIKYARDNGFIMPPPPLSPHALHKLQPLGVSFFKVFNTPYNDACREWMVSHPGGRITMNDIGGLVAKIFDRPATSATLLLDSKSVVFGPFHPLF